MRARVATAIVLLPVCVVGVACDLPILLAGDTNLTVAVPLPSLSTPETAPPLTASIEILGHLDDPLLVEDGVATGSFAFSVDEAASVHGIIRVKGQLTPADDIATLAVGDFDLDVGKGVEAVLDAVPEFTSARTPERPWLDLNRNDVDNRDDFAAGCDPAVPASFLRVSETDLQLPRDGDRAVVVVDNLLPRAIALTLSVVDAPGVGIDLVSANGDASSFAELDALTLPAGGSLIVAVSYAAVDAFFAQGVIVVSGSDTVDDGACGTTLRQPVRVLANVGGGTRPADPDQTVPTPVAAGGLDAKDIVAVDAGHLASGIPLNVTLSAVPNGHRINLADGSSIAADAVFVVDTTVDTRLDVAVSAAAFDVDLAIVDAASLVVVGDNDPAPAGSVESARLRNPNQLDGTVLIVVGVPGTTEAATLDVDDRQTTVSVSIRTSKAPRLLTPPDPRRGAVEGGTVVTFTGEGLDAAGTVFFGARAADCDIVDGANDDAVTCTAPRGNLNAGQNPVDVVYLDPVTNERATLVDAFRYDPSTPRVDSIEPSVIVVDSGAALTLRGFGFVAPLQLTIGGTAVAATVIDDATVFAEAPDLDAGAKDVVVTVFGRDGTPFSTTVTGGVLYLDAAVPPPDVTAVFPSSGDVAGGTTVNVSGSGFSAGARVFVGDDEASVLFVGAGTIIAATAPGAPGLVDVRVVNPDLQESTLADAFTYTVPPTPPPVIFTLVPSTGSTTGGEEVTVLGAGFADDATVSFGGTAAVVVSRSSGALVVNTPNHAAGLVDVLVVNGDNQAAAEENGFSFVAPVVAPPQVFSVSPALSPTAGGTVVTVLGANFVGPSVTVGGVAVTLSSQSSNALVFTAPPHAEGSGDVVVTNGDTQVARVQNAFAWRDDVVIVRDPTIADVSPDPLHGRVGGEVLRLIGADLDQTVAAAILAGSTRIPATVESVSASLVVVSVDAALPAGNVAVELVDAVVGAHLSAAVAVRDPVPVALDVGGRAAEGEAFTLLINGADLNPARLSGVRATPLDPGSGAEIVLDASFAAESIVAVDVADGDLGRGGWVIALLYEEDDGDVVVVPVDVLEVGGFCPGSALCDTCGDGVRDPGEDCDSADFDGETCATNGFDGGTLLCSGCQLDFNLCTQCGNGLKESGEQCDGTDLGGATCVTAGFAQGTVACRSDCSFDTVNCRSCGDGVCSNGETSANCAADCPAACGNNVCQANPGLPGLETCHSCPRDCGACAPYTLVLEAGVDGQHAAITRALPLAIRVRLLDAGGNGVPNVNITFGVPPGDAASEADLILPTDASGAAAVSWTLGPKVGAHAMTITANPADGSPVDNNGLVVNAVADDVAPGTIVRLVGGVTGQHVLGSGIRSQLQNPSGLAVDADGNLLFGEILTGNGNFKRLRLPEGVVETIINNSGPTSAGGGGDGGPASLGKIRSPGSIAVKGRDIFVVEDLANNQRVRRIDANGIITTFAGGGATGQPGNGDGQPLIAGNFASIRDISFDAAGDLVILDNSFGSEQRFHMRRTTGGILSTQPISNNRFGTNFAQLPVNQTSAFTGPVIFLAPDLFAISANTNLSGFGSDNLTYCDTTTNVCVATRTINVDRLARGPDGLIYTSRLGAIERNDGAGGRVVIAGTGTGGSTGDGGPATSAQIGDNISMAFNAAGDLFLMEQSTSTIRMIRKAASATAPATTLTVADGDNQTTRIFGSPSQPVRVGLTTPSTAGEWPVVVRGSTGGESAQSTGLVFTTPANPVAVVPIAGRVVGTQTWFVEVPAPLSRVTALQTSFSATVTPLADGQGLVVNSAVLPINLPTQPVSGPVIPASRLDINSLQGSGSFEEPSIAFRGSDVFVSSPALSVVWKIDAVGRGTALAGVPDVLGNTGDGAPAIEALLSRPAGIGVNGAGDVLFADPFVHRVRRVRADGTIVNAAGTGSTSSGGASGSPAATAIIDTPRLVHAKDDGSFFVADKNGVHFVDTSGVLHTILEDQLCVTPILRGGNTEREVAIADDPVNDRVLLAMRVANAGACQLATNRVHIFDVTNGTLPGTVGSPIFSEAANGGRVIVSMAVHPTDGRIFVVTSTQAGQAANYQLKQVNLANGTFTNVTFPGGNPYSIAFDADGTLWAVDITARTILQFRP